MRVTFNQVRDGLDAINTASDQFAQAQWQVSTGQRVRVPSDDPLAAQRVVAEQSSISGLDAYQAVTDSAGSRVAAMDSALGDMVDKISQALVAVQSALGTTATQAVRDEAATSLDGIRDAIAADINASFGGTQLFSGTNSDQQAYARISGTWTYQGSNTAMTVDVSERRSVTVGMDGQSIMQGSDPQDLLTLLDSLAAAARGGDSSTLRGGVDMLNNAFTRATRAQGQTGYAETTLSDNTQSITDLRLAAQARLSSDRDANMAEAMTRMSRAQTTYQAALGAVAAASKVSLLDYLK